jgi:hypothetical protein
LVQIPGVSANVDDAQDTQVLIEDTQAAYIIREGSGDQVQFYIRLSQPVPVCIPIPLVRATLQLLMT